MSTASAERLGELKHVVVDVGARRIRALHLAGRRRRAELVDWSAITGFGPDAIMVTTDDAVRGPADHVERAVVSGDLDLDGRLVLGDDGNSLGTLEDVVFDAGTGMITAVVAGGAELTGERLLAVGPHCVILRADTPA